MPKSTNLQRFPRKALQICTFRHVNLHFAIALVDTMTYAQNSVSSTPTSDMPKRAYLQRLLGKALQICTFRHISFRSPTAPIDTITYTQKSPIDTHK